MGFFNKIKEGLKKTRDAVIGQIDSMLKSFTKIDDELFEELEELLVMGDVPNSFNTAICSSGMEPCFLIHSCMPRVIIKKIFRNMTIGLSQILRALSWAIADIIMIIPMSVF